MGGRSREGRGKKSVDHILDLFVDLNSIADFQGADICQGTIKSLDRWYSAVQGNKPKLDSITTSMRQLCVKQKMVEEHE